MAASGREQCQLQNWCSLCNGYVGFCRRVWAGRMSNSGAELEESRSWSKEQKTPCWVPQVKASCVLQGKTWLEYPPGNPLPAGAIDLDFYLEGRFGRHFTVVTFSSQCTPSCSVPESLILIRLLTGGPPSKPSGLLSLWLWMTLAGLVSAAMRSHMG